MYIQINVCACSILSYCCLFVFVAAYTLSNPTNTMQPLQVPQFASTCAWKQQCVHLPHEPGYDDSSLQVSSAYCWQVVVLLGQLY